MKTKKNKITFVKFECSIVSLKHIKRKQHVDDIVDICAIIVEIGSLQEFSSRQPRLGLNGIGYKFKMVIADDTNYSINITFWNSNVFFNINTLTNFMNN